MELIILFTIVASSLAAPMLQSMTLKDDGTYLFYYETGKEGGSHSRREFRNKDGTVVGKYSYEDPTGELREVNYRAGDFGYVATGDVGVEGAPKSQFPLEVPEQEVKDPVPETGDRGSDQQDPEAPDDDVNSEDPDNFQDFPLEENVEDRPPEAFPQGFFLDKFTGLRRLPGPTKASEPLTTVAPEIEEPKDDKDEKDDTSNQKEDGSQKDGTVPQNFAIPDSVEAFHHLRSFPRLSPQEWANSMFHQPVFVYSFNQPDAYGYHYFY